MSTVIELDILRNSLLFKNISHDVLKAVAEKAEPYTLNAGETLFEQDDPSDALYFLVDGQIHVIRTYPDGYDVILATENPFYVIGELSMLADEPRTGKVVAVTDSDLIKVHREDIVTLCNANPEIAMAALDHLGGRLYQLNLRVRESAIGNVGARLASALLMLSGGENGTISNAETTITRLARTTAMDPDIVENLLKQWDMNGTITRDGRAIKLLDVEALRNIAG